MEKSGKMCYARYVSAAWKEQTNSHTRYKSRGQIFSLLKLGILKKFKGSDKLISRVHPMCIK